MKKYVSDIAFSTTVKKIQEENGSRRSFAKMEQGVGWKNNIDQRLSEFKEQRDSLYFGTANAEGQPYIQHRGGPKGFLKVLDDKTLAFADYSGNMQYITVGTLKENNKAYIFRFCPLDLQSEYLIENDIVGMRYLKGEIHNFYFVYY